MWLERIRDNEILHIFWLVPIVKYNVTQYFCPYLASPVASALHTTCTHWLIKPPHWTFMHGLCGGWFIYLFILRRKRNKIALTNPENYGGPGKLTHNPLWLPQIPLWGAAAPRHWRGFGGAPIKGPRPVPSDSLLPGQQEDPALWLCHQHSCFSYEFSHQVCKKLMDTEWRGAFPVCRAGAEQWIHRAGTPAVPVPAFIYPNPWSSSIRPAVIGYTFPFLHI